jgi:hypothetical protein
MTKKNSHTAAIHGSRSHRRRQPRNTKMRAPGTKKKKM